ncbi:hypothetical protein D3C74_400910 [compost metagenome]
MKTAGTPFVPLWLALKPTSADPPGARFAFHESPVTVTFAPVCVNWPDHELVIVWPDGNVKARLQPLTVLVEVFVTFTVPVKPEPQPFAE